MLPTNPEERKGIPIGTGVLDYFPKALAEVAKVSLAGNKQHGIGGQLKWDRSKSTDESDAMIRHYLERYNKDSDGTLHAAKMAWRALAFLEKLCEKAEEKTGANYKPAFEFDPQALYPVTADDPVGILPEQQLEEANIFARNNPEYRRYCFYDELSDITRIGFRPENIGFMFNVRGKVRETA